MKHRHLKVLLKADSDLKTVLSYNLWKHVVIAKRRLVGVRQLQKKRERELIGS